VDVADCNVRELGSNSIYYTQYKYYRVTN